MCKGVMFQFFEWNCRDDGSLWTELADYAQQLKDLGATAVWMPPAYKAMYGAKDSGYAPYDLYDLGEFNQKGSVRTKYGTKDEYIAAVKAVQALGMDAYADIVLDHRLGADETERVEIDEISIADRNQVLGGSYNIEAWSHFTFPGRGDTYSSFKWHWRHFVAFGGNACVKDDGGRIYRVKRKTFSGEVSFEHGNFDYLMGADVDQYDPEVREELLNWGRWYVETSGINGLRLDAVKHMPASFCKLWINELRAHHSGREIFAVGEYWSGDVADLRRYVDATGGVMRLFDVPLHYKFHAASKARRNCDLTKIFDGTLVKDNPLLAVTFVDNHDSQPGQSLQSPVDDWFKPLAYALILLREQGYPCLFYGDYFGSSGDAEGNNKLTSHRSLIDNLMRARTQYAYGELHDYLDHPQCIGWTWTGDDEHSGSLAVVMSVGNAGSKRMKTHRKHITYHDVTGHRWERVTTDEFGEAEFRCNSGSVSVWCA